MSSVATNTLETTREPPFSRRSLPGAPGWTPAHDDHSPEAVAWRAAYAVEMSQHAHDKIDGLKTSVDKLTTTMNRVEATISRGLGVVWKLVVVPVVLLMVGGAAALIWKWVSTLHH